MNKERYIIREKGTNNKVEYCRSISHSLSIIESLEARNRIDEVFEDYEIYDATRNRDEASGVLKKIWNTGQNT